MNGLGDTEELDAYGLEKYDLKLKVYKIQRNKVNTEEKIG